jgi:hypothetical protein
MVCSLQRVAIIGNASFFEAGIIIVVKTVKALIVIL